MAGFEGIEGIRPVYYGSGRQILEEFLLPLLGEAVAYDRVTGYFTLEALLATSAGLDRMYRRHGRMRLIIGIHDFPHELARAVVGTDALRRHVDAIRRELVSGMRSLSDEMMRDRLATVALMIEDGFLEVRVAATLEQGSIFHSKQLLLRDGAGASVAAVGSLNETAAGLGGNYENLVVLRSWVDPEGIQAQDKVFERVWKGEDTSLVVLDLTHDLAADILKGLGEDRVRQTAMRLAGGATIEAAPDMPSYLFVSGAIPALYQHQERAVLDGLGRWPVRVLFADEVGLGKTYEVATTVFFLLRFCGARRALILTPKSVLTQWQEELAENFGIEAWVYDSASRVYIAPDGRMRRVTNDCPLGPSMPRVALMSAQYARGSNRTPDVFSRKGTVLPDVLAVDEAHAARLAIDIGDSRRTTRLYRVLKDVADRIPHLILATATPMQRDAVEYHSLLSLLGLPAHWVKERAFDLSLSVLASDDLPPLNDLAQATRLLVETCDLMRPKTSFLSMQEADLLERLREQPDPIQMARAAADEWEIFRGLFVKLHPARLLTVRNTRRSLEEVGYRFCTRELTAVTLTGNYDILHFYERINAYIGEQYLAPERVLYPDRKFSEGFVRSGYQQRMASSLYSCGRSLARRRERLENLRELVDRGRRGTWDIEGDADAVDEDDALFAGVVAEEFREVADNVDASQVLRMIDIELSAIYPLERELSQIVGQDGDPKVDTSIDVLLNRLSSGDQVLLFSRYTDTVDALLNRWSKVGDDSVCFGVYTGKGAWMKRGSVRREMTKEQIREYLGAGEIRVMFCSDAASEGLNLQAARVLVNVDVPWTPARLEQRIGRIARLGQRAPSVEVVNVWYPDSVEQRMYSRISERLQAYNLAVGEFPEVVADSIRMSIIEGTEDTSIEMLQQMRNSLQTTSLSLLWDEGGHMITSSRVFREDLLAAVSERLATEEGRADTVRVMLGDGDVEVVCVEEGRRETLSLSSRCVREAFPHVPGCRLAKDADGRPCAYVAGDGVVDPTTLPLVLVGKPYTPDAEQTSRPKWLVDTSSLDLSFAVKDVPQAPDFWPPVLRRES